MSIRCPRCKKTLEERIPGIWPFCSEHCKNQDLGAWMREEYSIPGKPASSEELLDALRSGSTPAEDDEQ